MEPEHDVFPWTEANGLCSVLDDDEVMKNAFGAARDSRQKRLLRFAIRESCNRMFGPEYCGGGFREGTALRDLLRGSASRDTLFKCMEDGVTGDGASGRHLIANLVFIGASRSFEGRVPEGKLVCRKHGEKEYLDVPKFRQWIGGQALGEKDIRVVSLFVAAFAILQPQDGPEALRALLDRDVRFAPQTGRSGHPLAQPGS
jgi:hypothetical protein